MKLRTRRFLYSAFIALFFMAAPPLILYTAGFRYDFEYGRVVETGSLVVKSNPEGATIYLNGVVHTEKTPTIINTILPGKINLQVEKKGYHTWEKAIAIEPRVSAFEERIILYPDTTPEPRIAESIASYWWNSKQDKMVYLSLDGQLRLFNTLNGKDTLVANISTEELVDFAWSPHDDQFLFGRVGRRATEYFVINVASQTTIVSLHQLSVTPLTNVQWDPVTSQTVYALTEGSLVRIPYVLGVIREVYEGPVTEYLVEKKRIVILQEEKKTKLYTVRWFATSDNNTLHLIPDFSVESGATFMQTYSHRIALHNTSDQSLYILDPSIQTTTLEQSVEQIKHVTQALWSQDGSLLVYSDGFGIYKQSFIAPLTVIPFRQTNKLVTRYSTPITDLTWANDEFHISYIVGGTLRIAELGTSEDPRNTILLNTMQHAHSVYYVHNDESLYYIDAEDALNALPLSLNN